MADGEAAYVPGPGVPLRSPQLLRDLKPERPGVPETIEEVPLRIAIPLLVGKAHSELYEIIQAPGDPIEYGDTCEVLMALAKACGHDWHDVEMAAADTPGSAFGKTFDDRLFSELSGGLHGKFEAIALDLGDIEAHGAALEGLWSLAEVAGLNWEDVEILADDKRERLGGFTGHRLWSSHP